MSESRGYSIIRITIDHEQVIGVTVVLLLLMRAEDISGGIDEHRCLSIRQSSTRFSEEECSFQGGGFMKNVILIDDDRSHLAILPVALSQGGCQVIPKTHAESAVAVLGENVKIDLIILNYEMLGLDALSFMTMLRVVMPNVPVIVLTRQGNVDIYLKVMSLGALEYMSEPFRIAELRRAVQTAFLGSDQQGLLRTCPY